MRACILLLGLAMGGCAGATPQQPFCATVREPIVLAKGDKLTPATARRILAINESGVLVCGWKPPGK